MGSKINGMKKAKTGFTLIEILVVIGIIAILAAIVIIAINPARQFAQARNSQRTANVTTILNAVGQNLADNKGVFNCPGIVNAVPVAPTAPLKIGTGAGLVNLEACLVPTYVPSMVFDPKGGTSADTLYTIQADPNGRYTVAAPEALTELAISATPPAVTVTR